jgi:5'-3' exonuclease
MGIPGFYGGWIGKNAKRAILKSMPGPVSSVSIDLNGLFHRARGEIYGDKPDKKRDEALKKFRPEQLQLQMFEKIVNMILAIVQEYGPEEHLILAVDGVAPGAKIQQQRGRREKSVRDKSDCKVDLFDRNAITPGTTFMIDLDAYISLFLVEKRHLLPRTVIYSPHSVPGEGEHKIMDYYRSGEMGVGSHLLYGLDADLIMLSLVSPLKGIILSREGADILSIDLLKEEIYDFSIRKEEPYVYHDFVVAVMLIGNDFVPQTPSLIAVGESVETIISAYNRKGIELTDEYGIDKASFIKFVDNLKQNEGKRIAFSQTKLKDSEMLKASIDKSNQTINITTFRSIWYKNALGNRASSDYVGRIESIVGKSLEIITPQNAKLRVKDMILWYLAAINWTFEYYTQGTMNVSHDFAYPHYHAPLLKDIYDLLGADDVPFGSINQNPQPFSMLHQLLSVLPRKSRDLMPVKLQSLLEVNSPILDFYVDGFFVESDLAMVEHAGVAIIPIIDRQRIREAIGLVEFTAAELKAFIPGSDTVLTRSKEEQKTYLGKMRRKAPVRGDRRGSDRGPNERRTRNRGPSEREPRSRSESRSRSRNERPVASFRPEDLESSEEPETRRFRPENLEPEKRKSTEKPRTEETKRSFRPDDFDFYEGEEQETYQQRRDRERKERETRERTPPKRASPPRRISPSKPKRKAVKIDIDEVDL